MNVQHVNSWKPVKSAPVDTWVVVFDGIRERKARLSSEDKLWRSEDNYHLFPIYWQRISEAYNQE